MSPPELPVSRIRAWARCLARVAVLGTALPRGALAAVSQATLSQAAPQDASNPYGLWSMWEHGDGVARAVLVLLVLMSMASWYVMVCKLLEQSWTWRQGRQAAARFWQAADVAAATAALAPSSPFRRIAEAALQASSRHQGLHARVELADWMDLCLLRATDQVQRRLSSGLSLLATVGSTAPFVGLFGTVWGIYHALTAIGISGQASIDRVAGPVGEALIMTALGLAAAVPAVLGYNALLRRNAVLLGEVRDFSSELQAVMLSSPPA
ncbi:MAG: MotA/TolQ/ExbB proton channel family protein [Betaproteobacteria bacterium]|nr:MotA/TolQ/ExbB proton channel family protein [Betaproteobacteria bacterium]MBU6513090.1 MotA/TolQ/ExbB proton channel family protein [Betaproteobacteria bacterium]MDE1955476.1 MotA/TolQ/ExbB proton channel family protein [Betaproteobacteria bacterium]MDE2152857.1 MotA/TolQ/ExbB proton channel family protein [Betaproteobacteria bacterium]MDE2478998.1 MotA/TolQ/ExbB proton channel family protein [Betaproteobacteria bacterium]